MYPEIERFQYHFPQYKIFVYAGLNSDSIMFEGQFEASERLYLLYDEVTPQSRDREPDSSHGRTICV